MSYTCSANILPKYAIYLHYIKFSVYYQRYQQIVTIKYKEIKNYFKQHFSLRMFTKTYYYLKVISNK